MTRQASEGYTLSSSCQIVVLIDSGRISFAFDLILLIFVGFYGIDLIFLFRDRNYSAPKMSQL